MPGTTYHYIISAVAEEGHQSEWTEPAFATVGTASVTMSSMRGLPGSIISQSIAIANPNAIGNANLRFGPNKCAHFPGSCDRRADVIDSDAEMIDDAALARWCQALVGHRADMAIVIDNVRARTAGAYNAIKELRVPFSGFGRIRYAHVHVGEDTFGLHQVRQE